jgi:hypothetical protein
VTVKDALALQTNGEVPSADSRDGHAARLGPKPASSTCVDAPVEPSPGVSGGGLAGGFALVQEGLRQMQQLQQQTASAHQRFLETQQAAQRALLTMVEGQQRLLARAIGDGPLAASETAALVGGESRSTGTPGPGDGEVIGPVAERPPRQAALECTPPPGCQPRIERRMQSRKRRSLRFGGFTRESRARGRDARRSVRRHVA